MKRIFDVFLAIILLVILFLPMVFIAVLIKCTSKGTVIYWSDRVGRRNVIFKMPKFRSMRGDTPAVATHLLTNACDYLTPVGTFLRKSSLDELPQLWCILKGEMSFVGPRPALFNQTDLVDLRGACGVSDVLPGLTGWAQINGRDELPITEKVKLDFQYVQRQSLLFDMQILWKTLLTVFHMKNVKH